jgi:hypothetical protein
MTARRFDWQGWRPPAAAPRDDGPDSLREWLWRSYADHLEDLGYDLDGGGEPAGDLMSEGADSKRTAR